MYIINMYDKLQEKNYDVWQEIDLPLNKDYIQSLYPNNMNLDLPLGNLSPEEWVEEYLIVIQDVDVFSWMKDNKKYYPFSCKKLHQWIL